MEFVFFLICAVCGLSSFIYRQAREYQVNNLKQEIDKIQAQKDEVYQQINETDQKIAEFAKDDNNKELKVWKSRLEELKEITGQ